MEITQIDQIHKRRRKSMYLVDGLIYTRQKGRVGMLTNISK